MRRSLKPADVCEPSLVAERHCEGLRILRPLAFVCNSAVSEFEELAAEWISGRLHERFPDDVKAKRCAEDDQARFTLLNKTIGKMPLGKCPREGAKGGRR